MSSGFVLTFDITAAPIWILTYWPLGAVETWTFDNTLSACTSFLSQTPKPENVTVSYFPGLSFDPREFVKLTQDSELSLKVPPCVWFVYSKTGAC